MWMIIIIIIIIYIYCIGTIPMQRGQRTQPSLKRRSYFTVCFWRHAMEEYKNISTSQIDWWQAAVRGRRSTVLSPALTYIVCIRIISLASI